MLKHKQGFTIFEMLVAIAIFAIVLIVSINTGLSVLGAQRKYLAERQVYDNLRYVLELMAKEIRMSQILSSAGLQSQLSITTYKEAGSESVVFCRANSSGVCSASGDFIARNGQVISASDLNIKAFNFFVSKGVSIQPRVTMSLDFSTKAGTTAEQGSLQLQTSVTGRNY